MQNRRQCHPVQRPIIFRRRSSNVQRVIPLQRFLARKQYHTKCHTVRLGSGDSAIAIVDYASVLIGGGQRRPTRCNNNGALLIARVRGAAVASIVTVIVAAIIAIQSANCSLLHLPLSLPRQNRATILARRLGGEEEMRLTPLVVALAVARPRR